MTPENNLPPTWVEALNISPDQLRAWSAQVPEGKPLLVWCLEQGHISVSDYLEWAQETFGLAVLSSDYFIEGGLDAKFLKPHLDDALWAPWCFPVEHWDGVLFVACAEPPGDEPAGTRFVLADPRAMAVAWEREQAPAPLNAAAEPAEDAAPPPIEAPHGLSMTVAKPFVLNFDEGDVMFDSPPEVEIVLEKDLDDDDMGTTPYLSPPTQVHVLAPHAQIEVEELPPVPPAPRPALVALNNVTTAEDEAVANIYKSLGPLYTHVCVIRFGEDQVARLYRWSPTLTPVNEGAEAALNLNEPSFLRIVTKTGLPYHGYLVSSPAHQNFFGALSLDALPGCVTAIPLVVHAKIWGVLLAMGPETLQAGENLDVVSRLAEPLIAALIKSTAA